MNIKIPVAIPDEGSEVKSQSVVDSYKVLYSIKVILMKHLNIQASKSDQPTTSEIKCSDMKSTKSTEAKSGQPSTCTE